MESKLLSQLLQKNMVIKQSPGYSFIYLNVTHSKIIALPTHPRRSKLTLLQIVDIRQQHQTA